MILPSTRSAAAAVFLLLIIALLAGCASLPAAPLAGDALPARAQVTQPAPVHRPAPLLSTTDLGQRPRFERLSVEDGLSQSSVFRIVQDGTGYLWMGTEEGLNRYDGYTFTVYRHHPTDPESISDSYITALAWDPRGSLWVGTGSGGLNRYDPNTGAFRAYRHDPDDPGSLASDRVRTVLLDGNGTVWVGTDSGLSKLDDETSSFVHYRHNPDDPNSLSSDQIQCLFQSSDKSIWVGTAAGLDEMALDGSEFSHVDQDPEQAWAQGAPAVVAIAQDQEGHLWLATTAHGVDRYDPATGRVSRFSNDPMDSDSLAGNNVRDVLVDSQGALWVSTRGGLDRFDFDYERFIHFRHDPADPNSVGSELVETVYEDREGLLWVGTYGAGVSVLNPLTPFRHYRSVPGDPNSLGGNFVGGVHKDRQGILWVGTFNAGLSKIDRASGTVTRYRHDPDDPRSIAGDRVNAVLEDREGFLWIGTDGGLDQFDRDSGEFLHYPNPVEGPMARYWNSVLVLLEDRLGDIWAGSDAGLCRLDRQSGEYDCFAPDPDDPGALSGPYVWAILEDNSGALWVGTGTSGLNRLDRQARSFARFANDPDDPTSIGSNGVFCIFEDSHDRLWIGTWEGGLTRLEREDASFVRYAAEALPSGLVYAIMEDDSGHLWLSSNGGIFRFDPESGSIRQFDVRDGLQSNEFNYLAYHEGADGEMLFGGINGLTTFYPEQVVENAIPPRVVITSLTQGGAPIEAAAAEPEANSLEIRWPSNFFEFEFAALSFVQPSENQYAYILEGFDREWNEVGTARLGRYTNLPGGKYTLRVKGSNNDGVWNSEGEMLRLTVIPPVWEMWWFRGAAILVAVAGASAGYRLRLGAIQARSRELEAQVQERTRAFEQRTRELEERNREIEQRRREMEALYRANEELHRHLQIDQLLQALVQVAVELLGADKGTLMTWDDAHEALVVRASHGFSPATLKLMAFRPGEGIAGTVAVSGKPAVVEDAISDSRASKPVIEAEGIRSLMQVPIRVAGEVFGVFSADFQTPRCFSEDELRLLMALAQRAGLAIENAQLYGQASEAAALRERNRLARDLHDAVTQTLFSASLVAEVLPEIWANDEAEGRELLEDLRQLNRGALAEMRTLLLELRPSALLESNLPDLLRQLAQAVSGRTDTRVEVTVEGECHLPPDAHVAFYRIAQEALNNAVKHSRSTKVSVALHCRDGADGESNVRLEVIDNGSGFDLSDVPRDRLGLGIMRERAEALGSALQIQSEPGNGTRVKVDWKGKGR